MSLIDISNLTFSYDGSYDNVFETVSFQMDTNWRLGLVGRNGRGKTTLLRLLMGLHSFDGTISASVPFDYFPYAIKTPSLRAMEAVQEVFPELEDWALLRELSALSASPELLYQPYETLSGGEQTKVLLSALFLRSGSFLLIDEPTNHLDFKGRVALSAYLKQKKGFLLVSHDRTVLDGCVDHILAINRQDIQIRQGNFSVWWQEKAMQANQEHAENERLKKEIHRLNDAAKRTASWAAQGESGKYRTKNSGLRPDRGYVGHKAAKVMKRAKAAESRSMQAAEEKAGLLKNIDTAEALKIHPLRHPRQRILEARALSPVFRNTMICNPLSFALEQGQVLALTGDNGVGKFSILKLFAGMDIPYSGHFSLASGVTISYVSQDTSQLTGSLDVLADADGMDVTLFKTILRKFGFTRIQLEQNTADLSAGQRKKVMLARSLCQSAHLYIWDEPLNYIDLFSRMQLESLLTDARPTLLLIEHDRSFLDGIGAIQLPLTHYDP